MNEFKESLKIIKTENKEQMKREIYDYIEGAMLKTRESKELPAYERAERLEILLNTMKFLENYEENIIILDKELEKRRITEKYKKSKIGTKYNRAETKEELKQIIHEYDKGERD